MKNLDITLAQLPLIALGGYYIYQAIAYFQYYMTHPIGYPSGGFHTGTFVFLMTIGIILLGLALGLQEIRSYRAKREASIVQKEIITKEVVMMSCDYCNALIPQTSTFCPNCGTKRERLGNNQ